MAFAIDVLHVKRESPTEGEVTRVLHSIAPNRIGPWVRRSDYVIELPAGTAARTGTAEGDHIALQPAGSLKPAWPAAGDSGARARASAWPGITAPRDGGSGSSRRFCSPCSRSPTSPGSCGDRTIWCTLAASGIRAFPGLSGGDGPGRSDRLVAHSRSLHAGAAPAHLHVPAVRGHRKAGSGAASGAAARLLRGRTTRAVGTTALALRSSPRRFCRRWDSGAWRWH